MKKLLLFTFLLFLLFSCIDSTNGDLYLLKTNTNEKITLNMQKSDIYEILGEPKKNEENLFSKKDVTRLSYEEIIFSYRESTESLFKVTVLGPAFSWKGITIGTQKNEIINLYPIEYLSDKSGWDTDEKKRYNSVSIKFVDVLGNKKYKNDYIFEHEQEIYMIEFFYNSNEQIEKIELKKTMMWVGLPPVD